MANMYGKNRHKYTKLISVIIGLVVIVSMVLSYFALAF